MNTEKNTAEEWRRIPSAPNYDVSNLGRVRSWIHAKGMRREPRLMKVQAWSGGRPTINLTHSDGRYRVRFVSHLVAEAFIGPRPEGMVVAHRNDAPWDNRPENLHYVTYSENTREAYANGAILRGANPVRWGTHPGAKLTAAEVRAIRRRRAAGESASKLAAEYNVSLPLVYAVANGRRYAWVKDDAVSTELHRRVSSQARAMRLAKRALEKTEVDSAAMARMLGATERKAA